MPKWLRTFALPLVALSLVAAACGDDEGSGDGGGEPTDGAAAECNSDLTVGVALDVGGLGDNGFNDLSEMGLNQAIADGVVCEENTEFIEANSEGTNLDENTQSLAEAGYDVVIGTGFAFTPGINAIAPDYPDTSFGIIDGYATCGTACGLDRIHGTRRINLVGEILRLEEEIMRLRIFGRDARDCATGRGRGPTRGSRRR